MPPPPKGTPPPQGDTPTQVGPWVDIGDGGGSPIQTTPLLFSHCFIPGTAHPPTPKKAKWGGGGYGDTAFNTPCPPKRV